jgi:hypothetical protein
MSNPYKTLSDSHFWKKAVAEKANSEIWPVSARKFALTKSDRLATAGSCFAQNVAKYLRAKDSVDFIETEALSAEDPVFSGRYGNIYTARQLVQLFDECQSGIADPACAIQRHDGRYVDVNRPLISEAGFATAAEVLTARQAHITAIKPVFNDADVFVFTLGLTESWCSKTSGKVYPVCPGIYSDDPNTDYAFKNFSFTEILQDMQIFLTKLATVNPKVRVLLTVSPVPLTASFSDDHILTATMHSKSILRTVCGELVVLFDNAYYFPTFEMIANPYTAGSAYEDNLRSVRPDAIQSVMRFFESEYMASGAAPAQVAAPIASVAKDDVVCDDVAIESSMGF